MWIYPKGSRLCAWHTFLMGNFKYQLLQAEGARKENNSICQWILQGIAFCAIFLLIICYSWPVALTSTSESLPPSILPSRVDSLSDQTEVIIESQPSTISLDDIESAASTLEQHISSTLTPKEFIRSASTPTQLNVLTSTPTHLTSTSKSVIGNSLHMYIGADSIF